jgi:hypothetical protein
MDHSEIISKYIRHVLKKGNPPVSVHAFVKKLDLSEREFFENFGSFEGLEARIWEDSVARTIDALEAGEEWEGFSAQQKLLSFLYAYCDRILDQRSFFLARFPRVGKNRIPPQALSGMRAAFTRFANNIVETGMEAGDIACRGVLTKAYPLGFFGHLLSVIEFNLSDSSKGFERTDAYIEKSVRLAFDVVGTQAVDSAADLARFLTGRSWRDGGQS